MDRTFKRHRTKTTDYFSLNTNIKLIKGPLCNFLRWFHGQPQKLITQFPRALVHVLSKKIHGYAKSIILIKHNLAKIVNEMALGVSDKRYLILLIFGTCIQVPQTWTSHIVCRFDRSQKVIETYQDKKNVLQKCNKEQCFSKTREY